MKKYINLIILALVAVDGIWAETNNADGKKERGKRDTGQAHTNADVMVQNILQWLQGVYTQNSRKVRQGSFREYLPPSNTQKPRPFEPAQPGQYLPPRHPPYPPSGSITPQPPFPIYTNPATGAVTGEGGYSPYEPSESPSSGAPTETTRYPTRPRPTGYPTRPTQGYSTRPSTVYTTAYPTRPTGYPTRPRPTGYPTRPTGGYPTTGYPTRPTGYPPAGTVTYPTPEQTEPTSKPSYRPSTQETPSYPSEQPTQPTRYPTPGPTYIPTTGGPTYRPSTPAPTYGPTYRPSSPAPTYGPTYRPSSPAPTYRPTYSPTGPSYRPTEGPTYRPTEGPSYTEGPTYRPTGTTYRPTEGPSHRPTEGPTYRPTEGPTYRPSEGPSYRPTERPTTTPNPDDNSVIPTRPSSRPGDTTGTGSESGGTVVPISDEDLRHPPHIHDIQVQCAKDMMQITIEFNRQFDGIIYSKGFYSNPECRYVTENSGQIKYTFTVSLNSCGTEFINAFDTLGQSYLENVLVIQNEPGVQEVWDTIRAVRCLWEGNLRETLSVNFNVGMLAQEIVTFSGDTAMARLDIQLGRGPFAPAANGLVKIGEMMTLVVSVTGDAGFDIQVKECRAKDTTGENSILLTDDNGCVLKPKLFGAFQKTRETGNTGANIIAYAFFNAFKFPDIMDLILECNIELCKSDCEVCPNPNQPLEPGRRRRRRDLYSNETLGDPVTMGKRLSIILPEDLSTGEAIINLNEAHNVCVSTQSFIVSTSILITLLTASCVMSAYLWLKNQHLSVKN
ncbi:translation initiation factor IF-2-like [Coccinella septempunctata]|uniref:translation initiation factor IF-2-like n=1 Tax=Coccinella septempunctata TaxID=41139 RepID=UPI001D05E0B9|nr:translation initiation factor IF-2-like [Coccinella septempunctata]